jgi:ABC-type Mn2+/Zn2+ transport system permease subunit
MQSMIETLLEPFQYGFMIRAILVGIFIAISSSVIGSFLVLRKFSMIGHGLSHVTFAAVALSLVLGVQPIYISLPIVTGSSILILKVNERTNIHGDAAIGLVASFSVALGTILASVSGGFNIDLVSYLFGSILTITRTDLYLSIFISIAIILVFLYYYNPLFTLVYDEEYAKIIGIKTKKLNTIIAILTAATIVIGTRAIGTMLISSLIIFPMIISMQFNKGFKATILLGAFISIFNVLAGLLISFYQSLPSGSTIVVVSGIVFMIVYIIHLFKK